MIKLGEMPLQCRRRALILTPQASGFQVDEVSTRGVTFLLTTTVSLITSSQLQSISMMIKCKTNAILIQQLAAYFYQQDAILVNFSKVLNNHHEE